MLFKHTFHWFWNKPPHHTHFTIFKIKMSLRIQAIMVRLSLPLHGRLGHSCSRCHYPSWVQGMVATTHVEVQCRLKASQKIILHCGIQTMSYSVYKKKQQSGRKFDVCETNICCYTNNCNFLLSHRATTDCFQGLKKEKIHQKWSTYIGPTSNSATKSRNNCQIFQKRWKKFQSARD